VNWNPIPLHPAISGEYIFGFGKSVKFATDDSRRENCGSSWIAVAIRFLLGQDLAGHFGYGFNRSLQQDVCP
jgi:hypothetical protein